MQLGAQQHDSFRIGTVDLCTTIDGCDPPSLTGGARRIGKYSSANSILLENYNYTATTAFSLNEHYRE
jgi:hypothetical protein